MRSPELNNSESSLDCFPHLKTVTATGVEGLFCGLWFLFYFFVCSVGFDLCVGVRVVFGFFFNLTKALSKLLSEFNTGFLRVGET